MFQKENKYFQKIYRSYKVAKQRGEVITSRCHGSKISGRQQTELNSHCCKLHRSYSISLNLSNVEEISGLNSKGRYLSLQKAKDNFCVVFTYSIKRARKIRRFHVAVVQRRLRNLQKSVMHVQRCCFANLNLSPFCLSLCLSSVLLS